ncbi:uncharacterized protein LAJ45_01031 [Morchella importuna]|uniref:uncharacterized protein n=1 Tax=Morchella importuna TaxID=1174673 RepID=UPI001E8E8C72|nr:uncharacterized protein LAJ45_01031 [Morchella importuna]KAH8154503.1 hypothetical protein LAJ45_01031 [Morchella importuna]
MSTSTSILDLLVLWIASFSHNKAPFFLEDSGRAKGYRLASWSYIHGGEASSFWKPDRLRLPSSHDMANAIRITMTGCNHPGEWRCLQY